MRVESPRPPDRSIISWWPQASPALRSTVAVLAAAVLLALVGLTVTSLSSSPRPSDLPPPPLASAAIPPTAPAVAPRRSGPTTALPREPTTVPKPASEAIDPSASTAPAPGPTVVAATADDLASIAKTVPPPAGYRVGRVEVWGSGPRWALAQYTGNGFDRYAFLELTGFGWQAILRGNELQMCEVAVPDEAIVAIASILPVCADY
jgi:hypothetical protein